MTLVARPAGHGYAARVSRLHFHRWAVIFLLVSKLILGQFAHAMPHMAQDMDHSAMNAMVTSASPSDDDSPPCGSHAQADGQSGQSQDSSADEHAAKSCCKGGECACPCLHSPAATAAVALALQGVHDDQPGVLIEGAISHRLSGLFRPPA
jgi:hypothetical protein